MFKSVKSWFSLKPAPKARPVIEMVKNSGAAMRVVPRREVAGLRLKTAPGNVPLQLQVHFFACRSFHAIADRMAPEDAKRLVLVENMGPAHGKRYNLRLPMPGVALNKGFAINNKVTGQMHSFWWVLPSK